MPHKYNCHKQISYTDTSHADCYINVCHMQIATQIYVTCRLLHKYKCHTQIATYTKMLCRYALQMYVTWGRYTDKSVKCLPLTICCEYSALLLYCFYIWKALSIPQKNCAVCLAKYKCWQSIPLSWQPVMRSQSMDLNLLICKNVFSSVLSLKAVLKLRDYDVQSFHSTKCY
jgi:hypothetical protein